MCYFHKDVNKILILYHMISFLLNDKQLNLMYMRIRWRNGNIIWILRVYGILRYGLDEWF